MCKNLNFHDAWVLVNVIVAKLKEHAATKILSTNQKIVDTYIAFSILNYKVI